ncbi:MAG TPA: putative porin [Verrucomicrobiae bacterium]|jgi:hypothetical protein
MFLVVSMGTAMRGSCQDSTNGPTAANSADPLLDLFVQKGFVTQQEAEQVQAEAAALRSNQMQMPAMSGSKWEISKPIKGVELFGDLRLRYEDRTAADPAGNEIDLQRLRYAVRVGLRGDLFDQFYYGFRLDTGANARSPFVTLGNVSSPSSSSIYPGPFGKSQGGINIGEVYLGWHPEDWVDITVGKMPNPLYTSTMVWSANIAPEGFAERFKYPVGQAQFFANFGQFLYEDMNPNFSSGGLGINGAIGQKTDNIFMFAWQGGVQYQVTTNLSAKAAGSFYNYIGLHSSTATSSGMSPYYGDTYVGEGAGYLAGNGFAPGYSGFGAGLNGNNGGVFYESLNYPLNQVGLNDLKVVEVPFEIHYKIPHWKMETHLFGDFAYNLDGGQRAEAAANAYNAVIHANPFNISPAPTHTLTPQKGDVKAYQIGWGIGSDDIDYGPEQGLVYGTSAPRHSWEVRTYWQHVEQYSLDPNLLDWDFFNGVENLQGVYVAAAYAFTGNFIGTFRYGHATRINSQLGTGGTSGDIPQINPVNSYDLYQVDFTVRF